ncbi:beta-glucosidase [Tistlia consotensis]|uniref:beta-glucosidase n=1 Tax=Tistlia consotensis USBA 355 TaxID=560819 RepID=A0A1Y6C756_9PROT|nr:beta-glucosidase BglX [Tistlia consotensis]SMF45603.1 beta-glucosidase [Tistlia consotensis USBA 355]SNR79624.1 beta-glucosidase [Tistlia consotensis]
MTAFLDDLLARMSLADKVGQLNHPNAEGAPSMGAGEAVLDIETRIRRGEVGLLAAGFEPERLAELQRLAVEESPHGIPLLFTMDVIHGFRTVFPLPLALACSFDPELVRRTAEVAAREAAAAGVALNWAPMLDVSRDARWGRCAESPGEAPYLGSVLARAWVEGFQQGDLAQPATVMATAKHFAGYGLAEAGRDYNAVDASPYRLHNVVLPPFKAAVEAGVGAVMVGFHDLSGIPCTAHEELLQGVLRRLWGFEGLIISDYTAILELVHHGVAADEKEAAFLAFTAGVDIDLISEAYLRHLPALVAEGRIAEAAVDAACRRVLAAKLKLGLFEPGARVPTAEAARAAILTPAHRALAREAAVRSCVLLKNDGVLPLAGEGRIALVGPLADSRANMQGTWAVAARAEDSVTVLEGLRAALGDRVRHARGCNLVDDPNVAARLDVFGPTLDPDPRPTDVMIAEAVALARDSELVVACLGEAKEHSGESATRTDLGLPGSQRRLVEALAATGKPLVLVTFSGRPLALEAEDRLASAILHAWFPGSEAGHALADLLTGAAAPTAKLAMSFPRTAGQCPIHYAEPPTGRPRDRIGIDVAGDSEVDATGARVFRKFTTASRLEGPHTPLYPFGHGLTYGAVEMGPLELSATELTGEDAVLEVAVTVRNVGNRPAEETLQLYLGDPVASRSRPVRELKEFRKVQLEPGEETRVAFRVTTAELAFWRAERLAGPERVWEPGRFVVQMGGNSSADLQMAEVRWGVWRKT